MAEAAPWLKAMENGGVGEARARAFLMDRFWVLERSVDVEGADYLIQRRLTAQNFLDTDPPRVGVVQVKFIQDGNTSISLNKSYVCEKGGRPYGEFFLLVFTGREDDEQTYLLSSKDIIGAFTEKIEPNKTSLGIRGSRILSNGNYRVLHKRLALDRIDHALKNADFMANRKFLVGAYAKRLTIAPDQVDADFVLPLENTYGNLQKILFQEKQKMRRAMFEMEAALDEMGKILVMTDPEEAFDAWHNEVLGQWGASRAWREENLSFTADCFLDEDFLSTVKWHKVRLARVRELGLESGYFQLLERFKRELISWVVEHRPVLTDRVAVTVTYDDDTLLNSQVNIVKADGPDVSVKGRQVLHVTADTLLSGNYPSNDKELRVELEKQAWRVTRRFRDAVDRHYFPEEFEQDE